MDELKEELEVANLAIVALLAVVTEEQFGAVETALKALLGMFDAAGAALEKLREAHDPERAVHGEEQVWRQSVEAHLAMRERPHCA